MAKGFLVEINWMRNASLLVMLDISFLKEILNELVRNWNHGQEVTFSVMVYLCC